MGFLITIEAPDASGKATQTRLLREHLENDRFKTFCFSYPNYGSDAAKPAELYLSGALGNNPEDTGAYAASTFFAVDRYFSYHTQWKKLYEEKDTVIILDRYTTSNAVHQIGKLPQNEWEGFLSWLYDFEFVKLGLPVPDVTIALDVPPETSKKLLDMRAKEDKNHKTDIHEANSEYLEKCYEASKYASEKWSWKRVNCVNEQKEMLSREEIHKNVYAVVVKAMKEKSGK